MTHSNHASSTFPGTVSKRAPEQLNEGAKGGGDIPFPFSDQKTGQSSLRFSLRNCFSAWGSITE